MSKTNCPNCGAPIIHYYNYNCEYCGTFLNNLENMSKFLEEKEITDIQVSIERSFRTFGYEIMVTGIARDTFYYCKEYDPDGVMVVDDICNATRLGFKFLLKMEYIHNRTFKETVEVIKKYIPPEFKKCENYILQNIIIKAVSYNYIIDGRWR